MYYIVEDGDTLPKISEKIYGDRHRWTEIYDANPETIVILRGTALLIPTEIEPQSLQCYTIALAESTYYGFSGAM
jgi:nucleoid-associated protein YgaU